MFLNIKPSFVFFLLKLFLAFLFLTLSLAPQLISAEMNSQKLGPLKLQLPLDTQISLFSAGVARARHMAFDDQGVLFLSQAKEGQVVALPDLDKNGKADKTLLILENRNIPHGLAFAQLDDGYYLYVAEETQVIRLKRLDKPFKFGKPETIIANVPGGGHFTRTLKIKNNKLYLSVGSSCNVCVEESPLRAAISRFNLDGSGKEIFAEGLRNSVGIEFSPYTGELWGVNNGRDMLGDQHPKEELNIIQQGKHYGWPTVRNQKLSIKILVNITTVQKLKFRPTTLPPIWPRWEWLSTKKEVYMNIMIIVYSSLFMGHGIDPSQQDIKCCD